jgi:hypothetical protein
MQRLIIIIIIDFEVVVVNSQGEKRIRSYTSGCVQVWRLMISQLLGIELEIKMFEH